jgi:hypothetical protein
MAVAAADRSVVAGLEWELRDLLTTVCAGPVAFDHLAGLARSVVAGRAACAMTIATLQGVELVLARLERELSDRRSALRAGPITLNHRPRRKATVIITVHICLTRNYVLLTHDPLERNYTQ